VAPREPKIRRGKRGGWRVLLSFAVRHSIRISNLKSRISNLKLHFPRRLVHSLAMPRARRSRKTLPAAPRPARRRGFLKEAAATRPLASLVFLSPLLAFYVVGLMWVRPDLAATADVWLREGLRLLGVGGILAPTWLAVAVLLAWHLLRRDPWQMSWGLLGLMAAETALLVVPLLAAERFFHCLSQGAALAVAPADGPPSWLEVAMTSIGAGVYEELLFRLLLVGGPIFILRHVLREDSAGGQVAVVLVVAGLFAGAHHLSNPAGFAWTVFLFRALAGVYLGFIFVYRGLGIAAGVHILFNLVIKFAGAWGTGA
jgi:hypothetical protein